MAVCPRCGAPSALGDRFCGGCGASLAVAAAPEAAPITPPPAPSRDEKALKALSQSHQAYVLNRLVAGAPREMIVVQLVSEGVPATEAQAAVLDAEAGLSRIAPVVRTAVHVGRYAGEARRIYTQVVLGIFVAALVFMLANFIPFLGMGWGFLIGFLTFALWEAVVVVRLLIRYLNK